MSNCIELENKVVDVLQSKSNTQIVIDWKEAQEVLTKEEWAIFNIIVGKLQDNNK
ncbi:TPA: hypothetical protein QC153_002169 [Bacillus cereus]|nr:hypothetical protein [Bacillus cereus]